MLKFSLKTYIDRKLSGHSQIHFSKMNRQKIKSHRLDEQFVVDVLVMTEEALEPIFKFSLIPEFQS